MKKSTIMLISLVLLIILSSLPLLIYPFVLIANVMALAPTPFAEPRPTSFVIFGSIFILSTTLYPLVYLVSLVISIVTFRKGQHSKALIWQSLPLCYLLVIGLLATLFIWASV